MATTARLDLPVWRNDETWEYPLRVRGRDLTNDALAMQIRLTPDTPGAPLVDLLKVTNPNAEGLRVAGVTMDGDVPVTDLRIRLNKSTRQALPYTGELGDATPLAHALLIAGRTRLVGSTTMLAHAYGSDGAPSNRVPGYGVPANGMPAAGATLTIAGDDVTEITIDGADLAASSAEQARLDRLASEDARDAAELAAATATASSRYFPTRAAGEAGSTTGQLFSTDDGAGNVIYYRRTSGGSAEIGRALTPASLASGGGAALVGFAQPGGQTRSVESRLQETVSVLDFGAVGDGVANDSPAFSAAVASAPARGRTVVIPDGYTFLLDSQVATGVKKIRWVAGHCRIICPRVGFALSLDSNGSSFVGAGPGATILQLRDPLNPVQLPTISVTMSGGAVATATVASAGANMFTTPLVGVSASPIENDAAIVPTVANGQLQGVAIVAQGSGYTSAPTITIVGGGAGAIKINEAQHAEVRGFTIDMQNIWHAVGVYHYGGWYASIGEFETLYPSEVEVSTALLIDSHTLGVPGPTGSYGGVYVSHYYNIRSGKIVVVGHDTSTATTLQFDTIDATNVIIHAAIGVTFVNPVIQGDAYPMLDLVNTDAVTLMGGDTEGAARRVRVRGECNNLRIHGTLSYVGDPVIYGPRGRDWVIDFAKSNGSFIPLRTGTNGTAGHELQNINWKAKAGTGLAYSGGVLNQYMNLRPISLTQGMLADPTLGGIASFMTTSGQMIVATATAGANPRPLTEICRFSQGGDMRLIGLPTSAPSEGGRLWSDNGSVRIT